MTRRQETLSWPTKEGDFHERTHFYGNSSEGIASEIKQAHQRVILAMPGVHSVVAEALIETADRLGRNAVELVLDCAVETCHLGYGDIKAVKKLSQNGIKMRQNHGLKVGVLICDNRAWSFAPTALCVEEESGQDVYPNAIRLSEEQAEVLARTICPNPPKGPTSDQTSETAYEEKESPSEPEIGPRPVNEMEIKRVEKKLEEAPPQKFNVSRIVRVFQAYIQYVEVNLKGCSISQRKIPIPKYLLTMTSNEDLQSRLRTTFNLIENTSKISDSSLRKKLRKILDEFTFSLGEPYGRVMLRANRPEFDDRMNALCEEIELHKETIQSNLENEINYSIQSIIEAWVDQIIKFPPPQLKRQVVGEPTELKAEQWLCDELRKVFPSATELISEMNLVVHFKGVTYETLKDDKFEEQIRQAFPYVDWDELFNEYDAAQSRGPE